MYLRILLIAYIFTMPMLHSLSFLPVVSFNVIFLFLAAPIIILSSQRVRNEFLAQDLLVACVFTYGLMAWLWFPVGVYQDRYQMAIQWAFSFFALWWLSRQWLLTSGISFDTISATCFYATIFISVATIFEFILANTTGYFLSDFIPFSIETFPPAYVFSTGILRPRVFTAEAGFTAMSFELLAPLSIVFFRKNGTLTKLIYITLIATSYLLLLSLASFISFLLSLALLPMLGRKNNSSNYFTIITLFALGYASITYADNQNLPFYKIAAFFDSSNYEWTQGSRQEAYKAGLSILGNNPFGIGWGTVLQESKVVGSEIDRMILGGGLISLWLELAVSVGVAGALLFFQQLFSNLLKLARSPNLESRLCFVSLCSLTLHHAAIFEPWFPMFWFALALAQAVLILEGRRNKRLIPRRAESDSRRGFPSG